MDIGFTICLTGSSVSGKANIANLLYKNINERGVEAEIIEAEMLLKEISLIGLLYICKLLNRHKIISIVSVDIIDENIRSKARQEIKYFIEFPLNYPTEIAEQTTAKILLKLEEMGFLESVTGDYSEEEKAEIDQRLKNLGYM